MIISMRIAIAIAVAVACAACGDDPTTPRDAAPGDGRLDAPAVVEDVHFIGRFDAMKRFAWPGSQIRTRFEGTTLSADLDDTGANDYFDVTVDGTTTTLQLQAGRHVVELVKALAPGMHDLALTRRTETFFGTTTFYGFSGAPLV